MTINLLPENLKKERRFEGYLSYAFSILNLVTFLIVILAIGFFLADFMAQKDITDLNKKKDEQKAMIAEYNQIETDIQLANSKLIELKSLKQVSVSWSKVLIELSNCTPINLEVKSLSFSSDKKFSLTGLAETRAEIAKFKEKLEKSPYFKNVQFSSSVLNQSSNDYNFSMTGELESK